jgi:hypothetical protein
MCLHQYQNTALCIDCGRGRQNITWAASQPVGAWHPTVGYPVTTPPDTRAKPTPAETGWRWACIDCAANDNAMSHTHAHLALTMHRAYACPLMTGLGDKEIRLRLERRRPLSVLYPTETPWMHLNPQGRPVTSKQGQP